MPKKIKRTCGRCKYLFTEYGGKGNCFDNGISSGMSDKACADFKEGLPLVPVFRGRRAKEIKFDTTHPAAFVFQSSDQQMLAVMWQVDREGYGFWRIKQLGLSTKDGPVTRNYVKDKEDLAFYGDVAVVGARQNELWRSDGYDDDDRVDEEGNVTNKPVEVRVYPRRYED